MGKKASLDQIRKYFQEIRYIDTEFCQGNTMRWAIAWTLDETFHFPEQCQSQEAFKALKVKYKIRRMKKKKRFIDLFSFHRKRRERRSIEHQSVLNSSRNILSI